MDDAGNTDLAAIMNKRIARLETRFVNFGSMRFQERVDAKYRHGPIQYMAPTFPGVPPHSNMVPGEHLWLSTMVLPPGCASALHAHPEEEEVFFTLRGPRVIVQIETDDEQFETPLGERDLITVPPKLWRAVVNTGDEEALVMVILGAGAPTRWSYHPRLNMPES